jgi:hypothetical protein
MPISIYQKKNNDKIDAKLTKQALSLYKTGLTTRQVGLIVGRSHEWVARKIRKYLPKAVDRG